MEHLSTGQRVTIFRQRCAELEKIACKSARRYKLATAEIISLTNRLSNQKLGSNLCPVWVSAVDNTLRRSSNHMLKNKSPMINAHSATKTGGRKRACATCRDIFNMPMSVYKGHRSDSKKCPNRGKPHPHKPPKKRKVESTARTKIKKRKKNPCEKGSVKTPSNPENTTLDKESTGNKQKNPCKTGSPKVTSDPENITLEELSTKKKQMSTAVHFGVKQGSSDDDPESLLDLLSPGSNILHKDWKPGMKAKGTSVDYTSSAGKINLSLMRSGRVKSKSMRNFIQDAEAMRDAPG